MLEQIRLVLASASPRRRALLEELGIPFGLAAAEVDETPRGGEPPAAYVGRLALEKARAARAHLPVPSWVLAADTTVSLGGVPMGKPRDAVEARSMLEQLSGKSHEVLTAVALLGPGFERLVRVATQVRVRPLSRAQVAWYVATGEPMDKAGAYAIQGKGGVLIERIDGSHSNVIGLPLAETCALLEEADLPVPWRPTR